MAIPEKEVVAVKVWGDLACFTRPELKVERVSYPMMTPSAARGVLDAILFKKKTNAAGGLVPAFHWHIRRITALRPRLVDGPVADRPQFISFRRNEIQGKIAPRTVGGWIKEPASAEPYLVDSAGRESVGGQNRTQRNTLALRDVAYLIEASVDVGPFDANDPPVKYREMFLRRVEKGQCFHRPYLGCREFACDFAAPDGSEQPLAWTESLGLMLYDIRFGSDGANLPGFFMAAVKNGVLHCDTVAASGDGEPPVKVLGWGESA
ncbi:MAG: type I-C CRISPR-associated protein Cas5 [Phycisphaerales bacterium]|nr:type I-C CRISPR-associated protein Cas5 [Phycisphaerales bacterium]